MKQLIVLSLDGQSYTATAKIDRTRSVNGERDIALSFLWNEMNKDFLKEIETGWKVNFQGDWYHLFNEKEDRHGNKSFDTVLDFYHYFNGFWHVDEVSDKSMTAADALFPLFQGKDYVLQIIDTFNANTMSLSRPQNTTERFTYFIDRLGAEYTIPIGTKTVQIRNKIGVTRDDVMIHEDDNLIDYTIDVDTSSLCTAVKGYYNFTKPDEESEEEPEPQSEYEYISSMAEKYGIIWGEPVYDERFTNISTVIEACRKKQESTYKISFSIKANLMENELNEGDEVRFIAPSKGINTLIRVVEVKEKFDEDLELVDIEYTFGNEAIATQVRNMQYDAIQDVNDMLRGKKPLPINILPKAVREATAVINAGDSSTNFEYRSNGIYGTNTSNPLGVTRYNANGIGFSQDGGKTYENAITYLGIVATAITSGTIDTNLVRLEGTDGLFYLDGDVAKWINKADPQKSVEISPNGLSVKKGAIQIHGADGRVVVSNGYLKNDLLANMQVFSTTFDGIDTFTITPGETENKYVIRDKYRARYLDVRGVTRLVTGNSADVAYLDISIMTFGTEPIELFKQRETLTTSTAPVDYSFSFILDFQQYFGVVPDYRDLQYYVKTTLITQKETLKASFRINRGLWNG